MLPFGLIEQALRLINNLLEAQPPAVRAANAIAWFKFWWPIVSPLAIRDPKQRAEITAQVDKALKDGIPGAVPMAEP